MTDCNGMLAGDWLVCVRCVMVLGCGCSVVREGVGCCMSGVMISMDQAMV